MKKFLTNIILISIYIFIVFLSQTIYSQENTVRTPNATIDSLNNLAYDLTYSNIDSAFVLAKKAEKLSLLQKYNEGLGVAYLTIGTSYYLISKNDSAQFFFRKAEKFLLKIKKNKSLFRLYLIQGIFYMDAMEYSKASELLHNSLEISKEINDSAKIATVYINISSLFIQLGDINQGLNYLNQAYEISEKIGNTYTTQYCLINIALNYLESKQYKKSFNYLTKAKNLKGNNDDVETRATILASFAELYFRQEKYDSALIIINNALEQYQSIGNEAYIILASITKLKILEKIHQYKKVILFADQLLNKHKEEKATDLNAQIVYFKGKAFFDLKQYSKAKQYLQSVLSLPQSNDNLYIFRDTYSLLYQIAEIEHNSNEAFKQFKHYASLRDSVNIFETKTKYIDFEKLRELRVKEKEIESLKKDKIISDLKLDSQTTHRNFLFLTSILLAVIFIVVTINNIKIRAFNKRLKQLHESEERFLKIISHDIRNSLGAVINFSNLLINNKNSLAEEEKKESIAEINKAALATNNLLTNLLQWTLVKNDDLSFNPKVEDLRIIVNEGIASSLSLIKIKELDLIINIDNNIKVFIDNYSVTSVIRNLLTNAIKFSRPKGKLIFDAKIKDNFVYLSLTDNGVGMKSETLKNLFNDNVHNTSKGTNNEKGTGIGISLIKKFVEMNGGTIKAESQLGKGSTFTFSIPLANKN
jgi:signal transduction histidine kinase